MAFEAVLGQDMPKALVAAALARDRIGHAYLFSGPDGTGKTLFAVEFAKALLCRHSGAPHSNDCAECRMAGEGNHPDLHIVQAEADRRFITIAQSRELGRTLSLRPVQSQRRVAIVREAEHMREEAANSFLRTLEEPPPYAVLILTTARPRNLLETIRSRCQELRFAPLSPEHIHTILSGRPEFTPEEVSLASRLAQGSAGKAIQSVESGCIEFHISLMQRVLDLPHQEPFALSDEITAWMKGFSWKLEPQRRRLRELLRLLTCAYRDMLFLRMGGQPEELFHADHLTLLEPVARRLNSARITQIVEALWTARRQTDQNAALNLVLENLFMRVGHLQPAA